MLSLSSSENLNYQEGFEVVTAVMAHHYLSEERRMEATRKCYKALKPGGIYITFENITLDSLKGKEIGLRRWENYQIKNGFSIIERMWFSNSANIMVVLSAGWVLWNKIGILKAFLDSAFYIYWQRDMECGLIYSN